MTERLSDLLTREAHDLDVPAAPTAAVLRTGRGLRRRRQALTGAAGLAVVAAIGGTALAVQGGADPDAAPDPAGSVATQPVFAIGTTVYYDGPGSSVVIDDKAVKSLFYTSVGVAVRQGNNSYSDGGGPQRFSLVTPTGENQPLGLVTEGTVHASDPGQPYVAYAENVDGILEAVVYDVAADEEAARVPLGSTKESWFPVSIDGDRLYVQDGYDGKIFDVEWRTGEQRISDLDETWEIKGGHAATSDDSGAAVIEVDEGEEVLRVDDAGYFRLSPDGRFAQFVSDESDMMDPGKADSRFYDLETGESVTLGGDPYSWGWTTDGEVFRVDTEAAELTTCSAETGECTTESVDLPDPPSPEQTEDECGTEIDADGNRVEVCSLPPTPMLEVRLGGRVYES